ncbi:MAG TPA: vWA domain-containing protein [Thermoanaerobaculia bacterium]
MRRTALLLVIGLFAASAEAARDVRVVLDLSKSMEKYDRGRLAVLSTMLLYDLTRPNPGRGDSFTVIPFDRDWSWPSASAPPPVSRQRRISGQIGRRQEFEKALKGLRYDARMTYFYPGLTAAVEDLAQKKARTDDVRAVVLITDGVPEAPTRDAELQRIRDEIVPRLEQEGIRLYVLAFGGEAAKHRDFFEQMVRSSSGGSLGAVLIDPNGNELLSYMLDLFARSFGFTPDSARNVAGTPALDLTRNDTPERAAVVVFATTPKSVPTLRLTHPSGRGVNAPDGLLGAAEGGGGYSLLWVLGPERGNYGFSSNGGKVAVLRPTRLAIRIAPAPPLTQTERTMAATPFRMRVQVHSPTGATGPAGDDVALSFREFGERTGNSGSDEDYSWREDHKPPAGPGNVTAGGREYEIVTEFRQHPKKPDSIYIGHVEVVTKRGEAEVGALRGQHAHRVEVHPLLGISPRPLGAYASAQALGRREQACTELTFELTAGKLPHPERPSYPVRAVLTVPDRTIVDHELHQAAFTLDGIPLEFAGSPGKQPAAWYTGRALAPDALLGKHELCVRMGRPTRGDPARALELKLQTTLLDDPYDDFGVIKPFNLKVLVAPPSLYEKWRSAFVAAMALLALLLCLWYLRDRPGFPADLGYAVGREDSPAALTSRPLERSAAARFFAWVAESPLFAPGEDRPLGRVRPADAELFQFRPARGVRLEATDREEVSATRGGLATISVHRTYRLHTPRGTYLFRLEYR